MSGKVQEELVKSANLIREKYRALKRGKFLDEEFRLETLKPLTTPLNKLNKLVDTKELILPRNIRSTPIFTTSSPSRIPALQTRPTPPALEFGQLASKYLSSYLQKRSEGGGADTTYGIRKDPESNGSFLIGSEKVDVANDDITVGAKTYKGTDGLWQLLTQKDPENYDQEDLANYKEILEYTNAHKKAYKPDAAISSNSGRKYKNVISRLFTASKTGEGMKEITGNKIDYVYYNDPNEIVSRLRLLILSREAGNTGVNNEIESIIEELIESNIISK